MHAQPARRNGLGTLWLTVITPLGAYAGYCCSSLMICLVCCLLLYATFARNYLLGVGVFCVVHLHPLPGSTFTDCRPRRCGQVFAATQVVISVQAVVSQAPGEARLLASWASGFQDFSCRLARLVDCLFQ